ncbi:MAG: ABC-F family ATP-binding cassette domain-containing protein, partial [Synergistaceae bacterium]|nr:ABC-F family ATP-binding cassette domain-containing protein [Synergistaceae bacterium]
LDADTREIVERALLKYQGTLLIVSHDRHFLDALAERVLEIRDGILYDYPGNYSWFLEKREQTLSPAIEEAKFPAKTQSPKRNDNMREIREMKKSISQAEKDISGHESRISEIDGLLCLPETLKDSQKVQALMTERSNLARELEELYSSWEELSLKLEQLKQ